MLCYQLISFRGLRLIAFLRFCVLQLIHVFAPDEVTDLDRGRAFLC